MTGDRGRERGKDEGDGLAAEQRGCRRGGEEGRGGGKDRGSEQGGKEEERWGHFFLYLTLPNPLEGREGLGSLILFIEKVRTPKPALCIVMGAGDTTMEAASCLCGFAV